MKKILVKLFSIILIIACLFSLYTSIISARDSLSAKEYWEEEGDRALSDIKRLEDGIGQLRENQKAYLEGVETFEEGLATYAEGKKTVEEGAATLANGQAKYNENAAALEAAHKTYNEKVAALEAGKKEIEEGKKMLAENEQTYLEGKETLSKVEPIYNLVMPLYSAYLAAKAEYDKAVESGDLITAARLAPGVTAAEGLVSQELMGTGYSLSSLIAEVQAGKAKIKEYEDGLAKVQAGEKTIAESEAALAEAGAALAAKDGQLADAKNTLYAGYASYEDGKKQLEEGAAQLVAGKNQLAEFEDGENQVVEGLNQLIGTETYRNKDEKALVKSIAARLGNDYTYWVEDENGEIVVKNDAKLLDLDKGLVACKAGRDFVDDTSEVVTREILSRLAVIALAAVASILGIIGGTMGFCGAVNGSGFVGLFSALFAFGGIIASILLGGIEYPMCRIAGSAYTNYVTAGLIVLAVAAVVYTVIAFICYEAKKSSSVEVEATQETAAEA